MSLTSRQRLAAGSGLLLGAGFCVLVLAPVAGDGWYLVGVALLALLFVLSQLPTRTSTGAAYASPPATLNGSGGVVREVTVAFMGDVSLVTDRLAAVGWNVAGWGPATNSRGSCSVRLEIAGLSPEVARRSALRAVEAAGGSRVRVVLPAGSVAGGRLG